VCEFDPFFDLNLPLVISEVCEVHHRGLRVDGFFRSSRDSTTTSLTPVERS